nr:Chain A, Beta-KTx-like peptide LaIT2 [Liocheles australasiae]
AKKPFVQRVKNAASKAYNKLKGLAMQSQYGCPIISNMCEDHCRRKKMEGQCDLLDCVCS